MLVADLNLFFDKFISYNKERYKDDPVMLAKFEEMTLDDLVFDSIDQSDPTIRNAELHSDKYSIHGENQQWNCLPLNSDKVITITSDTVYTSLDDVENTEAEGIYNVSVVSPISGEVEDSIAMAVPSGATDLEEWTQDCVNYFNQHSSIVVPDDAFTINTEVGDFTYFTITSDVLNGDIYACPMDPPILVEMSGETPNNGVVDDVNTIKTLNLPVVTIVGGEPNNGDNVFSNTIIALSKGYVTTPPIPNNGKIASVNTVVSLSGATVNLPPSISHATVTVTAD